MPSHFTLCIIVLIALALFGLPIGLSMICASVFYLLVSGLDLGTAGEQILNGLFNSYVLLAVPLFILAADLMNSGSLTDRLLKFCLVLVGRFRGGLGHVNVVANIIFAGMSGSAIADAVGIGKVIIGMMTRTGNYPVEPAVPLRDIPKITLEAFPALMLPVVLLFGIYGGVMTPTEGAAAAAAYALLASWLIYRAMTWRQLYDVLLSSAKATTSVGMLIAGALVFNYVVTIEKVPLSVQAFISGFHLTPIMYLLLVNAILLVLGCLLEGSTILLVIIPIMIPTAKTLGIDLVHFGVVVVVNIMIGLLTPPFGLLLFVVAGMTKQPLMAIVKEALPFILMAIVVLAIITLVPQTILWLPRLMGY